MHFSHFLFEIFFLMSYIKQVSIMYVINIVIKCLTKLTSEKKNNYHLQFGLFSQK